MSDPVLIARRDAVAWITLNRPEVGNAIDLALARALHDAVDEAARDPHARCVVIGANGRLFCAGGDVAQLDAAGDDRPRLLDEILASLHPAMLTLARMEKPLVTAVNGPAAGAGLGLAAIGDIVLASPAAHFTMAYPKIGLTPDAGTTWLLPRLIGLRRAQEMALTNRRICAQEAEEMDLITRVIDEGMLESEVATTANALAGSAVGALGKTKRLLLESDASLERQLEAERATIVEQGGSEESRIGFDAFRKRCLPDFMSGPCPDPSRRDAPGRPG